jgi:DNA-binding transcriptional regulator LsrR (DeoR family)
VSVIKERTQKEIMDYIKTHSRNGKLTKSLLDIAEQIGYSNATVHRALKALEDKGLVEIKVSDRPTEPNTIIFKGKMDKIDDTIAKGIRIGIQMEALAKEFKNYIDDTNDIIHKLTTKIESNIMADQIVSIQDIPNTDLQQVVIHRR